MSTEIFARLQVPALGGEIEPCALGVEDASVDGFQPVRARLEVPGGMIVGERIGQVALADRPEQRSDTSFGRVLGSSVELLHRACCRRGQMPRQYAFYGERSILITGWFFGDRRMTPPGC